MFVTISIVDLLPFGPILVWLSDILHLREEGVVSQARPRMLTRCFLDNSGAYENLPEAAQVQPVLS